MTEAKEVADHVVRRSLKQRATSRGLAAASPVMSLLHKIALNRLRLSQNAKNSERRLEIGPGDRPIEGYEALNIVWTPGTDYVMRATRRMPFDEGTFDSVYASHVLEHIPWYQTTDVLREWHRIIRPGGQLEIWVPDGLRIAKAFVAGEETGDTEFHKDGWFRFNDRKDPAVWANGRIFSYGDGRGTAGHFNWHLSLFSERYLKSLFEDAGFTTVRRMDPSEVRGSDHGWINMGIAGTK